MKELIYPMKEQYEEYLTDESKFTGYADSISFPESSQEVAQILKQLHKEGITVTVQGGKTGVTGGAVPEGGHILNLSRMNKVKESRLLDDGTGVITVEPGVNLIELRNEISSRFRKTPLFWPPDPTETSACVGGIIAAGAQGITTMLYGQSQKYLKSVRIMDYAGNEREINAEDMCRLSAGREMVLLDTVFGKEGITGIIVEATLQLIPKPESIWGIAFFFSSAGAAGEFAQLLKEELPFSDAAAVAAIEFMDRETLYLIEKRKAVMTKIKELPDITEDTSAMIYVELHGGEEGIEELAEQLMEKAAECGSDPEKAWAVSGEAEVEKLHAFRHAAAETANLYVEEVRLKDGRITKLGTDMQVLCKTVPEMLSFYREELVQANLKGCVFGHILDNHLHINILPDSYEEYQQGIALLRRWAEKVKEQHGTAFCEHGIGKLKKQLLNGLLPEEHLRMCQELCQLYNPDMMINRGNVADWKAGVV